MTIRVLLRACLLAIVVGVMGTVAGGCGRSSADPPSGAPAAVAHPQVGFRSATRLDEHFRKHGREFGDVDRARYLLLAQTLRDAPVGGDILEARRADGVITRFDRSTGGFIAFNRDLTIRTFFRPDDGIAYFRRQARR